MDAVSVLKGRCLKRQHNEMVSICFVSPFYMNLVRKSQQKTENLIFVILLQDFA
jgi:hypothetical protein